MGSGSEAALEVGAGEVVRLPAGSRDILPDEARALRAITAALAGVFEEAGYGEVITPTLEYADVLARGDIGEVKPGYRFNDEGGSWLALRSDMTVPLARVAATRFPSASGPLRFWYSQTAYRPIPALQGRSREAIQAGIELFGVAGTEGDREILTLAAAAIDAAGVGDARLVVGDARLSYTVLSAAGLADDALGAAHRKLAAGDFVAVERLLAAAGAAAESVRATGQLLRTRGGADVLEQHAQVLGDPGRELSATLSSLDAAARRRVIVDIGHVRDLDYYSGLVFEVMHEAVGEPIGGGGRYDTLVERFGVQRPAVGFALEIDGVHRAQHAGGGR